MGDHDVFDPVLAALGGVRQPSPAARAASPKQSAAAKPSALAASLAASSASSKPSPLSLPKTVSYDDDYVDDDYDLSAFRYRVDEDEDEDDPHGDWLASRSNDVLSTLDVRSSDQSRLLKAQGEQIKQLSAQLELSLAANKKLAAHFEDAKLLLLRLLERMDDLERHLKSQP